MEFPVIINKSEYGYDAHCPMLRGCHSQGETLEEAQENIKDAIMTYLEMIEEELKGNPVYKVEVDLINAFH
ncbi:MAG: type II toxin-antitoxin system HicB family antitoxin [Nitrospirota bacterium]